MVKGRVRLIDIHTHIIPGVDDGSESIRMSLGMLALSAESGITDVVATPHCNIPGEADNYVSMELYTALLNLRNEAERAGILVRVLRGMEVFATPELPDLIRERKVWSLNGTHYLLMEFAFDEDPAFCKSLLETLRKMGVRPVVAHPERYFFIQDDPQIAYEWCTTGCALQVNKGSLLGRFGQGPERTARLLVDHGLAACVASDAHSDYQRSTYMAELSRLLERDYGEDFRDLLMELNPGRILRGETLLGYEPIPF